ARAAGEGEHQRQRTAPAGRRSTTASRPPPPDCRSRDPRLPRRRPSHPVSPEEPRFPLIAGRPRAAGVPVSAPLVSLVDPRGRKGTLLPNLIREVPRVRSRGPQGTGESKSRNPYARRGLGPAAAATAPHAARNHAVGARGARDVEGPH